MVMGTVLGAGVIANQIGTQHQVATINARLETMDDVMKMGFKTTDTTIKALKTKLDNALQHEQLKVTVEALRKSMEKIKARKGT